MLFLRKKHKFELISHFLHPVWCRMSSCAYHEPVFYLQLQNMASTASRRSSLTGPGTGWPQTMDKQKLHSSNSVTLERTINL